MVTKQHILDEIERTTTNNGGLPLGRDRFKTETGIKQTDWYGKYWRNWGEALVEAGYAPNQLNAAYDDDYLIEKLITFIEETGRYPLHADLRIRARGDAEFPSHTTFRRLGVKATIAQRIIDYCTTNGTREHVVAICQPIANEVASHGTDRTPPTPEPEMGFVYLMKSGAYYKIGRSNSVGRREYELGIQLPEPIKTVHEIKTDDPVGIEAYWHNRFADRRVNGEWFKLTSEEVSTFTRRTFM